MVFLIIGILLHVKLLQLRSPIVMLSEIITPVYPKLKEMAESLSIGILNSQDKPYNTRQLGRIIIDAVEALV